MDRAQYLSIFIAELISCQNRHQLVESPLFVKVEDHFPASCSLDVPKRQLEGRNGNFPVRYGSKRVGNVRVAEVMIDDLACLFALALFLFLPSGDALCALFFFGRQLRLSMRWPDQCSWHALCPIRSGIAASKIFLGNACSSHEAAEGIPLSFKQISGRLAGGTTQELLNVKGRLVLQHGLRRSRLRRIAGRGITPPTLLNLQGINRFSKKLGSLGGVRGVTPATATGKVTHSELE